MDETSLREWVLKKKEKGYSDEEIKNALLEKGHDEKIIKEIFREVKKQELKQTFFKILEPSVLKLIFPVLLFILLITYFFCCFIFRKHL